jgi:hypothetical protein
MPVVILSFRKLAVALGLAAALMAAAMPVAPASAKPAKKHKVSRPYTKNWVFRSTKLKRCVFIEVRGEMTGSWSYLYGDSELNSDHDSLEWSNMRLKDPSISATGWPILGAGCDSTKRWKMQADLSQGWYQSGCDLDVSVSVGFPWSVSASPSYSCGDNKVGHRTSTEGPSRKTLNQFNTGYPISFESVAASVRGGGVGFKGVITVRAHTKRSSDAVRHTLNLTLNK